MTLVIGGEMGCGGESFCAFGQLPDPVENRQQIDVGECELVTCEIAGLGDRLVKNPDLRARTAGVTASIALRSGLPSAVFGAA